MTEYTVKVFRSGIVVQRTYVKVQADSAEHAKDVADELNADELKWETTEECFENYEYTALGPSPFPVGPSLIAKAQAGD